MICPRVGAGVADQLENAARAASMAAVTGSIGQSGAAKTVQFVKPPQHVLPQPATKVI